MSRIGKLPIELPAGVSINVTGEEVAVKGAKVTLTVPVAQLVNIKQDGATVTVERADDSAPARANQGLTRALLNNAVVGVSAGFERRLIINGVGYRAEAKGTAINLSLGFSHPVVYDLPAGVEAATPTQTEIVLKSADKQALGVVAAEIRSLRPPEPYKGKGIRYSDETIRRKEGKSGA